MNATSRQHFIITLASVVVCVVSGCSPTVQEDRTIAYSAQGESVAFQHGTDGVYVASSDGTKLEKVFDSSDALAVSSPLFSPDGSNMIFTTAVPQEQTAEPNSSLVQNWDANPEGRRFRKMPVEYACWLRSVASDGQIGEAPVQIFSGRLDHPGYIAANLAVRWHPSGDRIFYIDQVDGNQVSLFEYHLPSKKTRRLIDKQANAMIFDWSSTGRYLVCSLLGAAPSGTKDGLWIIDQAALENTDDGKPLPQNWRHVKDSNWANILPDSLSLDHLRHTRPAWTANDDQFAFPSFHLVDSDRTACSIYVVQPETGQSNLLHQADRSARDIRWHPNSSRLAFIEGENVGDLKFIEPDGTVTPPVNEFPVRAFAGWNYDGSRLAYVSPEPIAEPSDQWSFLFMPIPAARDRVYVASGLTGDKTEMVHDKVRITFPKWSPQADEMSLWGTYSPTHRSVLSYLLPWTLRPGDPAATLDVDTKTLRWMAVNSHERSQVGHYYLMKRDFQEAWKWYEQAAADRPPSPKMTVTAVLEMAFQRRIHHDPYFFEFYCLWKLNKKDQAADRLASFRDSMSLDIDVEERIKLDEAVAFANAFLQASYMTEILLSLDAAADGIVIFNELAAGGESEDERFARIICQSQLMLASGRYQDYAILAREELSKRFDQLDNLEMNLQAINLSDPANAFVDVKKVITGISICLAMLPMASGEFVALLSEEEVRDSIDSWANLHNSAKSDEHRMAIDMLLQTLLRRVAQGDVELEELRSMVDQRLLDNPLLAPGSALRSLGSVEDVIKLIRDSFSMGL